jgi:hypothetical protein
MALNNTDRESGGSRAEPRVIAPYVTAWSTEREPPCQVVERRGFGIGYADETVLDRDSRGVLWRRMPSRHRQGRPEFGKVHPFRQRRAMRRLLCQVCAGPADQTDDGVLWLLPDLRGDWSAWPDGMAAVEPPVCVRCVQTSVRLCPALRNGAALIRVRDCPVVGVRGALYRSGAVSPVATAETIVSFRNPAIRWVRAANLVRELRGCTILPPFSA